MRFFGLSALVSAVIFTSASYANEPLQLKSEFSASEIDWINTEGSARVEGIAHIKLEDGSYKGCDGFSIELLPVTDYSRERIRKTYGNVEQGQILISQNPPKFTPDPKAYHNMLIKTQCEGGNVFTFDKVPAGEYFVMAFIIWPDADNAQALKGGGVMKYLQVNAHGAYEVALKN